MHPENISTSPTCAPLRQKSAPSSLSRPADMASPIGAFCTMPLARIAHGKAPSQMTFQDRETTVSGSGKSIQSVEENGLMSGPSDAE